MIGVTHGTRAKCKPHRVELRVLLEDDRVHLLAHVDLAAADGQRQLPEHLAALHVEDAEQRDLGHVGVAQPQGDRDPRARALAARQQRHHREPVDQRRLAARLVAEDDDDRRLRKWRAWGLMRSGAAWAGEDRYRDGPPRVNFPLRAAP